LTPYAKPRYATDKHLYKSYTGKSVISYSMTWPLDSVSVTLFCDIQYLENRPYCCYY